MYQNSGNPNYVGYQRRYHAERYARFKTEMAVLKSVPCADCGVRYPSYVMQFDHLRDKKFTISGAAHRSPALVLAEMEKCEVVCANCHAERTHGLDRS